MKTVAVLATFALFTTVASAATVSGVWNGAFRVPDGEHNVPQLFTFKQTGAEITGTGGPDSSEQYPVIQGQLASGHLRFEVKSKLRDFVYDLKEMNGELRGTVVIRGAGTPVTAEVWLKPVH
ncbi:hypothetical protein [Occallatibacter riparius]|uniref:DUF2147 domain-containing protein n=1 Tax=Occallatibacter riparius TaxID=1002689 RepID=A0A9J7BPJ4_9BACT|nr:hypothetical protein [Occallatibacter riparius]UWZ84804.1 hypothetical protein MOP44_02440 [Occallatibacter riparius]